MLNNLREYSTIYGAAVVELSKKGAIAQCFPFFLWKHSNFIYIDLSDMVEYKFLWLENTRISYGQV